MNFEPGQLVIPNNDGYQSYSKTKNSYIWWYTNIPGIYLGRRTYSEWQFDAGDIVGRILVGDQVLWIFEEDLLLYEGK